MGARRNDRPGLEQVYGISATKNADGYWRFNYGSNPTTEHNVAMSLLFQHRESYQQPGDERWVVEALLREVAARPISKDAQDELANGRRLIERFEERLAKAPSGNAFARQHLQETIDQLKIQLAINSGLSVARGTRSGNPNDSWLTPIAWYLRWLGYTEQRTSDALKRMNKKTSEIEVFLSKRAVEGLFRRSRDRGFPTE